MVATDWLRVLLFQRLICLDNSVLLISFSGIQELLVPLKDDRGSDVPATAIGNSIWVGGSPLLQQALWSSLGAALSSAATWIIASSASLRSFSYSSAPLLVLLLHLLIHLLLLLLLLHFLFLLVLLLFCLPSFSFLFLFPFPSFYSLPYSSSYSISFSSSYSSFSFLSFRPCPLLPYLVDFCCLLQLMYSLKVTIKFERNDPVVLHLPVCSVLPRNPEVV